MSWKTRCGIAIGLLTAVAVAVGTSLWWATSQSPEFYRVADQQLVNPVVRKQAAKQFVEQSQQLVQNIQTSSSWSQEFTDAQINAWLAEEFPRDFAEWMPPEVSQPRVQFRADGIRLGLRIDEPGQWSGVVSLQVKVSVPAPNQLAIQLQSIRAGLVPVPIKAIIAQVTEQAAENGVRIEWRKVGDDDVAIVSLIHEGEDAPQLEAVELSAGLIRVTGSSQPKEGAFQFEPRRTERVAAGDSEVSRRR